MKRIDPLERFVRGDNPFCLLALAGVALAAGVVADVLNAIAPVWFDRWVEQYTEPIPDLVRS